MTGPVSCYVSIPFGVKRLPDGTAIDHEDVFRVGVLPVLERLGVQALRADELMGGAIIMKSLFASLVSSDVMVADITGSNPNVMYELGVRHALRRNVTVMIMAAGGRIPYNVSYSRVLFYEVDDTGRLREAAVGRFQEALLYAVREGLARITNDSPLYEYYPELAVELPAELVSAEARLRVQPQLKRGGTPPGLPRDEAVERGEPASGASDPLQQMNELRRLRDASEWEALVRAADMLPPEVAKAPDAVQLVTLALNRLGRHSEAIERISSFIDETGGDAESYGILGHIYKDRYQQTNRAEDLEAAIRSYQSGFEKQPSEFYPGLNAVSLRVLRNTPADREELSTLLPRVRQAVASRLADRKGDYWTLASALELACIAGDWTKAEEFAVRARAQTPSPWMVESTAAQFRRLGQTMGEEDRSRLNAVIEILQGASRA